MKKMSQKTKFRVTFLSIAFIISIVAFVSTAFSYVSQILKNKNEISMLQEKYEEKLSEEQRLKGDISKLQDPEFMAKYAREKYLYSKDGEIIIKIEE